MTICGCLPRRLTEQCPFKPNLASGERENTKQMKTIPPLRSLKEEKHPNHRRKRDRNTKVLKGNKMKEKRKREGQENKINTVKTKKGNIGISAFFYKTFQVSGKGKIFSIESSFVNTERASTANNQGLRLVSTQNKWKELSLCPAITVSLILLAALMNKMSRAL